MTTTAEKHTPTPICYELALPMGTAVAYDLYNAKNSVGADISGNAADDPYSDEDREFTSFIGEVWGDNAEEWAARLTVCVNAFHSPTRTIPTENIHEGLVWKLYDVLTHMTHGLPDLLEKIGYEDEEGLIDEARSLLSSLKVEQSDAGQP